MTSLMDGGAQWAHSSGSEGGEREARGEEDGGKSREPQVVGEVEDAEDTKGGEWSGNEHGEQMFTSGTRLTRLRRIYRETSRRQSGSPGRNKLIGGVKPSAAWLQTSESSPTSPHLLLRTNRRNKCWQWTFLLKQTNHTSFRHKTTWFSSGKDVWA